MKRKQNKQNKMQWKKRNNERMRNKAIRANTNTKTYDPAARSFNSAPWYV